MFRIILGMSEQRKRVLTFLDGLADRIVEHVAKCAMYQNSLGRYDHWVHELAVWFADANDKTCKPNNKKLSVQEYKDTILDGLGTSSADARINLHELQHYNKKYEDESYPYVEVDEDMIERMYKASQAVIGKIAPLLASKNNLDRPDIELMLHETLDTICL